MMNDARECVQSTCLTGPSRGVDRLLGSDLAAPTAPAGRVGLFATRLAVVVMNTDGVCRVPGQRRDPTTTAGGGVRVAAASGGASRGGQLPDLALPARLGARRTWMVGVRRVPALEVMGQ